MTESVARVDESASTGAKGRWIGHHPFVMSMLLLLVIVSGVVVCYWSKGAFARDVVPYELGQKTLKKDQFVGAVRADWAFVAGYGSALIGLTIAARLLAFSKFGKRWTAFGIVSVVVAVVADYVENALLVCDIRTGAAVAATIKFSALVPATLVAIFLLGSLARLARSRFVVRKRLPPGAKFFWEKARPRIWEDVLVDGRPGEAPPESCIQYRWWQAYWVPGIGDATPRGGDPVATATATVEAAASERTALCLSGGGVRSGCVAMGAMQALSVTETAEETSILDDFDYVISVSGGGYSAGARLLALQAGRGEPVGRCPPMKPSAVFGAGTFEFDHMRKHSSYIADSPGQMGYALLMVAKNLVLSLMVVFAPAVALGVVVGYFYDQIPLAAFVPVPDAVPGKDPNLIGGQAVPPDELPWSLAEHQATAWIAIAMAAGVAIVLFSVSVIIEVFSNDEQWRHRVRGIAMGASAFALLVLVIVVALPGLMRLCAGLADDDEGVAVTAGAGVSAVVVLNYFAVLAAMAWKNKGWFSKIGAMFGGGSSKTTAKALPRGVFQLLIVILSLAALAAAWLITLGGVAAIIFFLSATDDSGLRRVAFTTFGVAVAAILVVGCPDVTSSSLHPFYRRRLARAFAVRPASTAIPRTAHRYPDDERTSLHEYGRVPDADKPQFVFAAAATVSGEKKPAPGLNVVSFTLSAEQVGGPDLGWMKTGKLHDRSTRRIKRDLTVQAAVAISGAAFASTMGRQNNGYQALLAISGARLGTWLPNPNYLRLSHDKLDDWSWPHGLPRLRGFSYLFRELLGINPDAGRLVQVTDGGHYENLGLVEALRRKCTVIYCIDGSGDAPPRLGTLADAIRLAKSELGVEVTLDDTGPYSARGVVPGTGADFGPDEQFEALNNRITAGCVIRGRIDYPDVVGGHTGTLIYAKAVLWQDSPYWLKTYAAANDVFPHDSTSDQWFNEGQFAAYTELGRLIGAEAIKAAQGAGPGA